MAAARDRVKCECGRQRSEAQSNVMRSFDGLRWAHLTFYRCACGREWTITEIDDVSPTDTITADEILTVHEHLSKLDGPLSDLLSKDP